jgi:hypothetical protein
MWDADTFEFVAAASAGAAQWLRAPVCSLCVVDWESLAGGAAAGGVDFHLISGHADGKV